MSIAVLLLVLLAVLLLVLLAVLLLVLLAVLLLVLLAVLLLVLLAVLLLVLLAVLLLVLLAVLLLVLLAVLLLVLLAVLLLVLLAVLLLVLLLLSHGISQTQVVARVRILGVESQGLLVGLDGAFRVLSGEEHVAHVVPSVRLGLASSDALAARWKERRASSACRLKLAPTPGSSQAAPGSAPSQPRAPANKLSAAAKSRLRMASVPCTAHSFVPDMKDCATLP